LLVQLLTTGVFEMQKFDILNAVAAPFPYANVDTDRIIRIERCARVARQDIGLWAFESERFREDGLDNPEFVLNQPMFRQSGILIASENFGCGSSREMAVWAIAGMGIRCVIAPSFGEIFFGNCFQNGVLPIRLSSQEVADLQAMLLQGSMTNDASQVTLTVDLVEQIIKTSTSQTYSFDVDPLRRISLLEGLDPIALTLKSLSQIEATETLSKHNHPWVWSVQRSVL
jgi:3-isopropylmalate/(R)-2-methylmalate dehydratase small subunit